MPTVTRERYDAFVLDLDGTLLDGRGQVTPRTIAAIARLKDEGYAVVLATGRSPAGTQPVHEALGLDTEACCYNGAWVGSFDGRPPWHYAPIPDDLVGDVLGAEGLSRYTFRHQGGTGSKFTPRVADEHHRRLASWYLGVVEMDGGRDALPTRDLVRVSLFFDGPEATDAAWASLPEASKTALHREVFALRIFPEFADLSLVLCEVQRRGLGKAEACRWLSERRGIPRERVVAVGDHANDVPLLKAAGLAVAMGNSAPPARQEAHLVIGDHREDGFARFVEDQVR